MKILRNRNRNWRILTEKERRECEMREKGAKNSCRLRGSKRMWPTSLFATNRQTSEESLGFPGIRDLGKGKKTTERKRNAWNGTKEKWHGRDKTKNANIHARLQKKMMTLKSNSSSWRSDPYGYWGSDQICIVYSTVVLLFQVLTLLLRGLAIEFEHLPLMAGLWPEYKSRVFRAEFTQSKEQQYHLEQHKGWNSRTMRSMRLS